MGVMAEYRHSAHATFDLKYHVGRPENYRKNSLTWGSGIGGSICGPGATSVRRWARGTSKRSKPILKTRSGKKTIRASKSQRPPSLEAALQPRRRQAASASIPSFSRQTIYRL